MVLQNLVVQDLPFVMFSERKQLPSEPCIYFVMNDQGSVLYIGRSINPNQRLDSHYKYDAFKVIDGVKIAYLPIDETLLYSVEKALLAWFKPPLNEIDIHTPKGIEALRRNKGLTQSQVAEALGIDVSTVRNWERGREGQKMFVRVAKLCDLFECNPWDLVEKDEGIES